jgi:hypothetical protein
LKRRSVRRWRYRNSSAMSLCTLFEPTHIAFTRPNLPLSKNATVQGTYPFLTKTRPREGEDIAGSYLTLPWDLCANTA